GRHRHSPFCAVAHSVPSPSSHRDPTHGPNVLLSHCVVPFLIAHNIPMAVRARSTPLRYPPAHTVPSRSSRSALTLCPASSGCSVSVPLAQLARPASVPIQSVPSRATSRLRIQLLGRCRLPGGDHGILRTPSK